MPIRTSLSGALVRGPWPAVRLLVRLAFTLSVISAFAHDFSVPARLPSRCELVNRPNHGEERCPQRFRRSVCWRCSPRHRKRRGSDDSGNREARPEGGGRRRRRSQRRGARSGGLRSVRAAGGRGRHPGHPHRAHRSHRTARHGQERRAHRVRHRRGHGSYRRRSCDPQGGGVFVWPHAGKRRDLRRAGCADRWQPGPQTNPLRARPAATGAAASGHRPSRAGRGGGD